MDVICVSLVISDAKQLFVCLLVISMFFGEMSVEVLCQFFNQIVFCLLFLFFGVTLFELFILVFFGY